MAARNPGPYLQNLPMGFPSYSARRNKDIFARKAFAKAEVNTRVYKTLYEALGIKGPIPNNRFAGIHKIRNRCSLTSQAHDVSPWFNMSRHGIMQAYYEGLLLKYGFDPERRH